MSDAEVAVSEPVDQALVDTLTKRVERERSARREAESIAEEGLRKLYSINQDLDRRVQERVAESEQLARRAANAERVKTDILSSLSHELRTPLMAVVGSLDLIAADAGPGNEYLEAAIAGASQLRHLVDELFEVAELGSGSAQAALEEIDLSTFVDETADRWRMSALKAGILLVTSMGPILSPIRLDPKRTAAALNRLIENAIKYSENGTVTIGAEVCDDRLVLTVIDEGIGIEEERLAALLEPFETGDRSSTRDHYGVGLGLTVARGLVENMDGTVLIESTFGVGTTVTIRLPTGAERPTRSEPTPS